MQPILNPFISPHSATYHFGSKIRVYLLFLGILNIVLLTSCNDNDDAPPLTKGEKTQTRINSGGQASDDVNLTFSKLKKIAQSNSSPTNGVEPGRLEEAIQTVIESSDQALPSEKLEIINNLLSGTAYDRAIDSLFTKLAFEDTQSGVLLISQIKPGKSRSRAMHKVIHRTKTTAEEGRKIGQLLNQITISEDDFHSIKSGLEAKKTEARLTENISQLELAQFIEELEAAVKKWDLSQ